MSGDNLLGEQPIKFYSREMTESKMKLVHHYLKSSYQGNSITEPKHVSKGIPSLFSVSTLEVLLQALNVHVL